MTFNEMTMTFDEIFEILEYIVTSYRNLKNENAQLKQDLATALTENRASDEAIRLAQEAADATQAKDEAELDRLEALVESVKADLSQPDSPVVPPTDAPPISDTTPVTTLPVEGDNPDVPTPDSTIVSE